MAVIGRVRSLPRPWAVHSVAMSFRPARANDGSRGPRGTTQLERWLGMLRHLAHEPQKVAHGMSNVEAPCRKMATKSRKEHPQGPLDERQSTR
jgi:hypothetical protein